MLLDQRVELFSLHLDALDQLLREEGGVSWQDLVERPARHVLLVEGDDGGAALVRAAHSRPSLGPRDVSAAARVYPYAVADVHEQRHAHGHAGLERGGLVAAA